MGISTEISMEDYFERLNENDKLAYRKSLCWKVAKLYQIHRVLEMIGLNMLMLFLKFHGKI